jgi:hypothetical protein
MSTGRPSASLTLRMPLSKFSNRNDTRCLPVNGKTQRNPPWYTVPR